MVKKRLYFKIAGILTGLEKHFSYIFYQHVQNDFKRKGIGNYTQFCRSYTHNSAEWFPEIFLDSSTIQNA